jgi:hypothetical protein
MGAEKITIAGFAREVRHVISRDFNIREYSQIDAQSCLELFPVPNGMLVGRASN